MEHYYTNNSETENNYKTIDYYINNEKLSFLTNNAVFSKSQIDFGSDLLNKTILDRFNNTDTNKKLIDIGCGYGALGLTLGHFFDNLSLTLVDINERAIELCKHNANELLSHKNFEIVLSNNFENIDNNTNTYEKTTFDIGITNPPIRTGKANIFAIYDGIYNHLNDNGEIFVVIQKKQGALSSKDKLTQLFGNCEIIAKKSGYMILHSIK